MKLTRLLLIAPVVVSILTMIGATTTHVALAYPQHCDQSGWPACYSVGYQDPGWIPKTS